DTKLDRFVALKFLHKQFIINEEEKNRFINEAKSTAALDHPNICAVHEIDETQDGQMFIAMAYYEGETLREKILGVGAKGVSPLPINNVIDIAIQVAQGLQRAHESNIIHRDIKSANIIITRRNEIKIVDFGLAKLKGHTNITKTGTAKGTVSYMSPEQASGEAIDHRTDLWSLGVVLYEMITGQLPFKGVYDQAIIYSILNEKPEEVSGIRSGIPMELDRIIRKTLEKSPENRYQDMVELLLDLEKLKKQPRPGLLSTGKSGFFKALKRLIKPVRIPTFTILAAVIIIAGYFLFNKKPASIQPTTTPRLIEAKKKSLGILYFKNNTGDRKLDYLSSSLTDLLITDLAQSRFLRVMSEEELLGILEELHKQDTRSFNAADLRHIASRGKVDHLLVGKYNKIGDDFIINITLHDSKTGEIIGAEGINGKGINSIYTMVDALTRKIKNHFKLTSEEISADIDLDIRDITTSSLEALGFFIQGTRLYNDGKFRDSIKELEKAVAIDPEFAMAYRYLAINYSHLRIYDLRKQYLKKALLFLDRLTLKERYKIQAAYIDLTEFSYLKPVEIYKDLLKHYPEDAEAMIWIGSVYRNLEEWDESIKWFDKVLKQYPSWITYMNLAYMYICQGLPEKARELLLEQKSIFADKVLYHKILAFSYLYQKQFDQARREIKEALRLAPDMDELTALAGHVHLITGEPEKARQIYLDLKEKNNLESALLGYRCMAQFYLARGQLENCKKEILAGIEQSAESEQKSQRLNFLVFLAYLYIQQGDYESARSTCQSILDLAEPKLYDSQVLNALHLQGLALLNLNQIPAALEKADGLKNLLKKTGFKKGMRHVHHLQGCVARTRKQYSRVLHSLKKACLYTSTIPIFKIMTGPSFYQDSLARTLTDNGQMDQSISFYEKVVSQPLNLLMSGDIYVRGFYWLGKLYADRGWKGKAIENLEQFLKLWKDADSALPEIAEAKNMLTKFKRIESP
ncbi:MAG: protein kinase, partial [Candidatus Aminicenantes bacterium]|nr:protein kinase [Candidatus Aminicenantes bacterium]